jgi:hypothetical protein
MLGDLKVILPLKDIPEGNTVTKINGTAEYIVRDKLDIYHLTIGSLEKTLHADGGCRFLVAKESGYISVCPPDKELVWHAEFWQLEELNAGTPK